MDTLVHQILDPNEDYDFVVTEKDAAGEEKSTLVKIRENAKEILSELAQEFDVYLYESASPQFVNQVAAALDPKYEIFSSCLNSQHCFQERNGEGVSKDLRVLPGKGIQNMSYISSNYDIPANQLSCFVPILPSFMTGIMNKDESTLLVDHVRRKAEGKSTETDTFGLNHFSEIPQAKGQEISDYFVCTLKTVQ